jgi:hypothetical protein
MQKAVFLVSTMLPMLACADASHEPSESSEAIFAADKNEMTNVSIAFALLGSFEREITISRSRHGLSGMPDWIEVIPPRSVLDSDLQGLLFSDAMKQFLAEDPALEASVASAPRAAFVTGQSMTPSTLGCLREAIAVVQAVSEAGTVAIVDLQALTFQSPDDWRTILFEPEEPDLRRFVRILVSEETESDGAWLHTRGLRTLGHRDFSLRNVPPPRVPDGIELINRLAAMSAQGHVVPDGQPIRMTGLPDGMRCQYKGTIDDPQFNNLHVEIRWPREAQ